MKQKIRLTESDLHRIVKKSVNKVVRESIEGNLYTQFQAIDKSLSQIDNETYVSRFYSDENQITIAVSRSVNRLGRQRIIEIMKNYGYRYSTSGSNGEYIMMTFEPIIVTESNGKGERILGGKRLSYGFQDDEQPVFIDCSSPNDADFSVEIGFSDYSSSLFYVGECGTDGYAALEAVVEYLIQNGIIDHYTADEELVSEYPNDFIEVNGYYFDNSNIVMHQLVGYHGERRH